MTAWIALCLWPVISVFFFRSLSLPAAICATILGGHLLLPSNTALDLPVLPPLNKVTIPAFAALVGTIIVSRSRPLASDILPGWIPRHPLVLCMLGFLVIGTAGTVLTNQDPLFIGPIFLSGLRIYDGFAILLTSLTALIPFLIARKVMVTPESHRSILVYIVGTAFAYSFLALYEVRMSPQLNVMVYGFFPHSFAQHVRGGGFRPLVFLSHGLSLGLYLSMAVIAAVGLARTTTAPERLRWMLLAVWLLFTLVLAKTLGALLIALLCMSVIMFLGSKSRFYFAFGVAILFCSFPAMRAADIIPVDRVLALAENIDPQRAASFEFRLDNEDILLERAAQRPLFGWGGYSRNRIFDDNGQDISVTDGIWIIWFGVGGWFHYISMSGLLTCGLIALALRRRGQLPPDTIVLSILLAANFIDLIPNAGLTPLTWLIAGALAGCLERKSIKTENSDLTSSKNIDLCKPARPGYTRFPTSLGPKR